MARFKYLKGDSFFHRMDPTWKLIWNFVMVAVVIVNFDVLYAAAWYVYVLLLALFAARIPLRQYLKSILAFAGFALFMCIWVSIYYNGPAHEIWTWGPLRVTVEGLGEGLALLFRILVIISLTSIYTLTTDPGRLVESLIQVARLPYRIGYTAYAALRFIPLYENEAQVILDAHQIRGVGTSDRGPIARLRLYTSLLVPLLVSGIRRAQASSLAMDSRAFGAYATRTVLHRVHVTPSTKAFVLLHVAVGIAAFAYYVILGRGASFIG